jgi:hypothetical protein
MNEPEEASKYRWKNVSFAGCVKENVPQEPFKQINPKPCGA